MIKCPYCVKFFDNSSQLKIHVNDHLWSKQSE